MLNVDLRQIQPSITLQPVPDGWYKVRIIKTNIKQTSKGDGGYLECQCEILEGAYQGRIVYWNLNLFNPSQQATEIAYKQLSAIGHCIGVYQVNAQQVTDATVPMFHNLPFLIWVIISQGNQGPINNVKGCKDIHGNDPGKQGGAPSPMPMQQPQPAAPMGATAPAGWSGAPAAQPAPQPAQWQQPPQQQQPQPQQWQPGTNQPPPPNTAPAWQPNQQPNAAPANPGGGWTTAPAPNQPAPQGQPAWQQQPQQQQPPQGQPAQQQQPTWGGQPTQQQQPAAQPTQWTQQQPGQAAPWQR